MSQVAEVGTDAKAPQAVEVPKQHPLFSVQLVSDPDPKDDEDFFTHWRMPMPWAQRMGMLRFGLDTLTAGKVKFYFSLAEGCAHPDIFVGDNEDGFRHCPEWNKTVPWKLRQKFSIEAHRVLGQKFFPAREKKEYVGGEVLPKFLGDPEVMRAILHFFRMEADQYGDLHRVNPRRSHHDETNAAIGDWMEKANDFAMLAVQYIWYPKVIVEHHRDDSIEVDEDFKKALTPLRPQAIEVLYGLQKLMVLLNISVKHDLPEPVYELDQPCLESLKKIALSGQRYFPDGKRAPSSVEESAVYGNQAATVLLVRENLAEEFERQKELKQAVADKKNAEETLRRFNAKFR